MLKLRKLEKCGIDGELVKFKMGLEIDEEIDNKFEIIDSTITDYGDLVYYEKNSQGIYEIGLNEDGGKGRWWSSNPDTIKRYLGIELIMITLYQKGCISGEVAYIPREEALKYVPEGFIFENDYVRYINLQDAWDRAERLKEEHEENERLYKERKISYEQYKEVWPKYNIWSLHDLEF